MFLTEKQASERLNNPNNLANRLAEFRRSKKLVLDEPSATLAVSKAVHLPRMSIPERASLADKALSGEYTNLELAEEYAVSPATVSRIKSQAIEIERQDYLLEHGERPEARNERVKEEVKNRAIDKMMLSMGLITEEGLSKLNAVGLASVATNLSKVAKNIDPPQAQGPLINLVIYSPETRSEDSYKIIEIKQNPEK